MKNRIKQGIGVISLTIGLILSIWVAYNFFSPTLDFHRNYFHIAQIAVPVCMVWIGWNWIRQG